MRRVTFSLFSMLTLLLVAMSAADASPSMLYTPGFVAPVPPPPPRKLIPIITWVTPSPIPGGTPLSTVQLDATASAPNSTAVLPGTFAYSPGIGSVLRAGTQTLSVTFTPTDTTDYAPVTQTVSLTVNPAIATTTLVTLSPITSFYQYAVVANVTVTAPGGVVVPIGGTVSCTATPPSGSAITTATVSMNGTSTLAEVMILGLPITPTGTSYSVICSFTSANTAEYANSDSTASPALGTVIAAPPPINMATGSLLTPRAGQAATLLNDGTVLVTGGAFGNEGTDPGSDITTPLVLQSTEIYSGGSFAYAAQMTTPRWRHTATLLNGSGQVLLTGGSNGSSALASAELFTPGNLPGSPGSFTPTALFDPATGAFTGATSQMNSARYLHTATLLNNGQILLAGGQTSDGSILGTAELYNPLTGTFTLTGPMTTTRWMHTATLLPNGTVLIAGGQDTNGNTLASAEIYTPSTNQFTAVGSMLTGRSLAQATLLGNGTVLITGGASSSCGAGYPDIRDNCSLAEAEIYTPGSSATTGSFAATASPMSVSRYLHTATVLYDETVLIAGGLTNGFSDTVATEESYNVQTGVFTTVGSLLSGRYEHTATLLTNNVGVLLVGGEAGDQVGYVPVQTPGFNDGPNSAELYEVTTVNGGLHPKYVVLDVMYAPPGLGSTMAYSQQTAIGSNTSTTNSFTNGLSLNTAFGPFPKVGTTAAGLSSGGSSSGSGGSGSSGAGSAGGASGSAGQPTTSACGSTGGTGASGSASGSGGAAASSGGGSGGDSVGGGYTYQLSGSSSYALTTTTSDCTVVPGPNSSQLGVSHESDIIWVWLNPETDYTLPPNSGALVWNGYSTNSDDPNVATGQMDVIPLSVSQLDGTSPIPAPLQEILDRNWDPVSAGGAGGLTANDLATILQRDPFATNIAPDSAATLPTNIPLLSTIPIFDPNIPTLDPVTGICGTRYTFDPVLGQTFPYSPLSVSNGATPPTDIGQPVTSTYTLNSAVTQNSTSTTTDSYQVGISAKFGGGSTGALGGIVQSFMASDSLTFVNSWNSATSNSTATVQNLIIQSPLASSGYAGPTQMQVWQDNLYGTYMFYPKPNDTTINLQSSQASAQFGDAINISATVIPDPTAGFVPSGKVTFYDGCTILGTEKLLGGIAKLNTIFDETESGGTVQTHVIRALYSGDSHFFHNVGNTLTQAVTSTTLPYISSAIAPSSGAISTQVTLTGVNFGTSGTVSFKGVAASTSSWSSTSIVATVPVGATTGPVTVTTGSSISNSVPFTVTQPASTSTTTTLILTPTTSWSGYPVVASTQVTAQGGAVPPGTVNCISSPSTGSTNTAGPVNTSTGIAQVSVQDMPTLPSGQTSVSYTEMCTFTPSTGGSIAYSSSQSNPVSGTVVPVPPPTISVAASLNIPRENQQATLLNDGTLLITGGDSGKYAGESEDGPNVDFLQSAEIYNSSSFVLAAEMTTPRSLHQATLLSNSTGQVLITGGTNGTPLASAELFTPGPVPGTPGSFTPTTLYDPAAQAFTTTVTNMNTPRYWHTATLLPSGKVLIVGGTSTTGNFDPMQSSYMVTAGSNGTTGNALATAELYDPSTGEFTYTSGPMTAARTRHTATLLADGTVLIAGGMDVNGNALNTAEIYNPGTDTFTQTKGNMIGGRIRAQATRLGSLQNETVLITGGSVGIETNTGCPSFRAQEICSRSDAEIYDPVSQTFTATQSEMSIGRYSHTATLLTDGTVLVAGGITDAISNTALTEEVYSPATGQFGGPVTMEGSRYNQTATLLPAVGVLLVGGAGGNIFGSSPLGFPGNSGPSAELYSPPLQGAGVHPKFMVLNVLYAPPGSGSSVTYTNSTLTGTSTTQTQTAGNNLSISLGGTIGIASITATGGYTFAQNGTTTYGLSTTTTDATTVLGPSTSSVGVDHEADVILVWLNPESDFALTNPGTQATPATALWTGYATNQNDPNVASGQMDIVPLTISQLDGTSPIPSDLQQVLDRNWDPISAGGAGGLTTSDFTTILQRDPFAVNLTGSGPSTAATNTPSNSSLYPVVDPNIPTHDANNTDPNQCGQRYEFEPSSGQTIQFSTLGSTNQALSQTYSLQSNQTQGLGKTVSDTYFVGLSIGVCFGLNNDGNCGTSPSQTGANNLSFNNQNGKKATAEINLAIGDKYSWGHTSGASINGQTLSTQALTIKNPLSTDNYTGPVQMQVWKDNLFGTYMFYPKPTDTSISLSTSAASTQTGNQVVFTAAVAPDSTQAASSNGETVPTGSITFYDGCSVVGTPQTVVNGIATVSTSWPSTAIGQHTIQAVYSGDSTFFHNDAPALTETVVASGANLPYILPAGLSPASGAIGSVVTISGQNFGSSGIVAFNGVPATTSTWNAGTITATVPVGAATGPVVVTVPSGTTTISSNGVPFTVSLPASTTTTTLILSPSVSLSGSPVTAHVTVTGPQGIPIQGSVTCGVTGATPSPTVAINQVTATANVPLIGLPTVTSGATAPAMYTASCAFVSTNSNYAGSQSNVAIGTVTNSPAATNAVTLGALNTARENQQANLLQDGTILITGGVNSAGVISSSEIYSGGLFNVAAPMSVARTGHQATLLGNSTGQVLVTGGTDDAGDVFFSAELFTPGPVPGSPGTFGLTYLYDPVAQAFTSTVSTMNTARYNHTATLLNTGKVLITGGEDANGNPLDSAELFDPIAGNFSYTTGTLQSARYGHTASLLPNGTVLLTGGTGIDGGALNTAEIYNPATDTFTSTRGTMTTARSGSQAVSVVSMVSTSGVQTTSSLVLVTGGHNSSGILNSAELYNVSTGTFSSTQDANGSTTMAAARYEHTATLLIDGTVLIAGGQGANGALSSEEIYNPNTGDFSTPASSMVTARYNHTATLMSDGSVLFAGGFNGAALSNAEIFTETTETGTLYPKFMVLDVLYAPPGAGSTMTYTDQTTVGTSTSTNSSFSHAQTASAAVTVGVGIAAITPEFQWGHTFTQDGTSSYLFSTATTNTTVVPGAVAAGTASTTKKSTGVDHESDIIQVWLNPATNYTGTSSSSNAPLIWNGFATNPNDPNVTSGGMDIVSITVSQLDGTSPIPSDLQDVLDRNWDSLASGGAGGLLPADFKTILQRDPFATNTSLNGSPAVTNSPTSYFDPNIPVADPLAQGQCSTRYNFDPVLGQTFPFGQLGSTNQPLTQTYALQSSTSQATGNTTTDQYSVGTSYLLTVGIANVLDLSLAESNTSTWTNTQSITNTNATAVTQALSIKNPTVMSAYTGPTQMQVWVDKIFGTFMFYPKASDTFVALTSSQASAGFGDTIVLSTTVTADPRIAASTNPPLTPTGVVNFYDGCTLLGSPQINSTTGQASIAVSSLAVGNHSILAAYNGDANFSHNTSTPIAVIWSSSATSVPHINQLSQTSGVVGSSVVVSGVNFGSSGTVTFNGVSGTITSWSATSITATVPATATSGLVSVTSGSVGSNGIAFVVDQSSGLTSTSVTLSPATTWSGYPITADVIVAGPANTIPSGSVSCTVASSTSTGTPTRSIGLNASGFAQVSVTDLPIVPVNGTSIPFTVTCAFTGTSGFVNSQSSAVAGTAISPPTALQAAVGSLNTARENQQASLLEDGTILVTGGDNGSSPLSSAEIYVNGAFVSAASMTSPRSGHQQTLLSSGTGQVLITGGTDGSSLALASAELFTPGAAPGMSGSFQTTTQYDPAARIFTNNPTTMTTPRFQHTATQLTTGQVLIAGGSDQNENALASAELFNPLTGSFAATGGPMNVARTGQNATLLLDGTVLISGGSNQDGALTSAEIYNPLTNLFTFTQTANGIQTYMNAARVGSQATRLGSGMVLITGGQFGVNTAELYNPSTGTFTYTQNSSGQQTYMVASRSNHAATLLYDNTVLITGGEDTMSDTLSTQELYDPTTGNFSATGSNLQVPRHNQTATLLPTQGVLIAGGENTTASGSSVEANAELFSPSTLTVGIHPKFMVANIQYAPPGSGSTLTYSNATTIGTSTGTENSFSLQVGTSYTVGVNFGIFSFKDTTTNTWTDTSDNSSTYATTTVTSDSQVVPGPLSSTLGVDHESDVIWLWLNPIVNYTITSPSSIVWNGFGIDSNDTNVDVGTMDVLPLSVSQLDGTSAITQAEWDILDRNWDPVASGGAGPLNSADFKTILGRDPFATNLSGIGRATAPTTSAALANEYAPFDPNIETSDPLNTASPSCGNRYDFAPGFNMTFPYTQLGSSNQAITQNYTLSTLNAQSTSSTTTDTYQVSISGNLSAQTPTLGIAGSATTTPNLADQLQLSNDLAKNDITASLTVNGQFTWTNKWTTLQNNSVLQSQALSIKNPLSSDDYTGPEQIQVWKDNLYGTFMFYPKPSDTSWVLTSSQTTIAANGPVTLTATVTADESIPYAPTGTVTFYDGCVNLGTATVNTATGTASLPTTQISTDGANTIQATYSGDANFYHNNATPVVVTVQ